MFVIDFIVGFVSLMISCVIPGAFILVGAACFRGILNSKETGEITEAAISPRIRILRRLLRVSAVIGFLAATFVASIFLQLSFFLSV